LQKLTGHVQILEDHAILLFGLKTGVAYMEVSSIIA